MRATLSLTLLLSALVLVSPPAAASGPCDNQVEELVCDVEESVRSSVQHLCDHWLYDECRLIGQAIG